MILGLLILLVGPCPWDASATSTWVADAWYDTLDRPASTPARADGPTTAQLVRELSSKQQILVSHILVLEHEVDALQKTVGYLPVSIDAKVLQLQVLEEEKLRSLLLQNASTHEALVALWHARDKSQEEKDALEALALAKAELHVGEQLKELAATIGGLRQLLTDKTSTLKERLDRMEGEVGGVGASWGVVLGLCGVLSVCLSLWAALRRSAKA